MSIPKWPRLLEGEVREGKGAQKKNIIFFSTSLVPSKIRIHEKKKGISCVITGKKFHNPKLPNVEFYGTLNFFNYSMVAEVVGVLCS